MSFFWRGVTVFCVSLYVPGHQRCLTVDETFPVSAFCYTAEGNKKVLRAFGGVTLEGCAGTDFNRFSSEQVAAIIAYLWWRF